MKKFVFALVGILIVVGLMIFLPAEKNDYDYLRLHIVANSNSSADQLIKYKIKDEVMPIVVNELSNNQGKLCKDLSQKLKTAILNCCKKILKENNAYYPVSIDFEKEFYSEQTYSNTTLKEGFYNSLIIKLGKADGDGEYDIVYPPLNFMNNFENETQISFKSKILDWFKSIKN